MADIKQAAKWMQEGKVVHRSSWGGSPVKLHVCYPWEKVRDDQEKSSMFSAVELLAEDWEISE